MFSLAKDQRGTIAEIARALAVETRRGIHNDWKFWVQSLLEAVAKGEIRPVFLLPTGGWVGSGVSLKKKATPSGIDLSPEEARKFILQNDNAPDRLLIEVAAVQDWRAEPSLRSNRKHPSGRSKTRQRHLRPETQADITRKHEQVLRTAQTLGGAPSFWNNLSELSEKVAEMLSYYRPDTIRKLLSEARREALAGSDTNQTKNPN
jgi:hypothetical protein